MSRRGPRGKERCMVKRGEWMEVGEKREERGRQIRKRGNENKVRGREGSGVER